MTTRPPHPVVELIDALSPYRLALMADAGAPDNFDSPGAVFLERVASDVSDRWAELAEDGGTVEEIATELADDGRHEIAYQAVPIYTHDVWLTFVDLAAYQEDPTELGADAPDMEQAAKVALYMIADRLVGALVEYVAGELEEQVR